MVKSIASCHLRQFLKLSAWNVPVEHLRINPASATCDKLEALFLATFSTMPSLNRVWNIQTGQVINELLHHKDRVNSLKFTADTLVTASGVSG